MVPATIDTYLPYPPTTSIYRTHATVPTLPYLVLVGRPGERLHAAEIHDGEALMTQNVA